MEDAVYIGLGANLGDAQARILTAVQECSALPGTRLVARSSVYRTAPVDAAGDDYINAVIRLESPLAPLELLDALQAIENRHGRQRPYRNAPRTLDLDLLLYGGQVLDLPRLTVPHPRMHLRAFVLVPLAELDPDLELPGLGPLRGLLAQVGDQRIKVLPR